MKKIELIFFLVGFGIFSLLIYQFGIRNIVENIVKTGWGILYIFAIWLVVYVLNTTAWWMMLGTEMKQVTFFQLFMITVSGFAINYITPMIGLGGEPYKMYVLARKVGTHQSVSAVILYRLLHLLAHTMILLTGVISALLFVPLSSPLALFFVALGVGLLLFIIFILSRHQHGVFQQIVGLMDRFPMFHPLAARLQTKQEEVLNMDRILTYAYRHNRKNFYTALVLEYLSRCCMVVEVYVIMQSIHVGVTFGQAFFMYTVYSLAINLLFFIPFNVGVREGGLYVALQNLVLTPILGVYIGIVMRIREFLWIIVGFVLMTILGERKIKVPQIVKEEQIHL